MDQEQIKNIVDTLINLYAEQNEVEIIIKEKATSK